MLNVLAEQYTGGGTNCRRAPAAQPELVPVPLLVQKRDRDPDEVGAEEAAW